MLRKCCESRQKNNKISLDLVSSEKVPVKRNTCFVSRPLNKKAPSAPHPRVQSPIIIMAMRRSHQTHSSVRRI